MESVKMVRNAPTSSLFDLHHSTDGRQISSRIGHRNVRLYAIVGVDSWGRSPVKDDVEQTPNMVAIQPVSISISLTTAPPEDRLLRAAQEDGLDWSVSYSPLMKAIRETVGACSNLTAGLQAVSSQETQITEKGVSFPVFRNSFTLALALARSTMVEAEEKCNRASVKIEFPALMMIAGGTIAVLLDASAEELEKADEIIPSGLMVQLNDVKLRLLIGLNSYERKQPQTVRMWLEAWDEHGEMSRQEDISRWTRDLITRLEATDYLTLEALTAFTTALLLEKELPDGTRDEYFAPLRLGRVSVRFIKPHIYTEGEGPVVELTRYR